jgi:8-oxo-dGTP pyrophosphatase MutT (NUDIX family)
VSKSASTSPVVRPAATVIVLRDARAAPEVFMVRRHEGTAFMGGAYVFPGGRVDERDRDVSARWCDGVREAASHLPDLEPAEAVSYHVAAARELFEEAGVLVARSAGGPFIALTEAEARQRFKRYRADLHAGAESLASILERERLRLALDALVPFAHWVTPPVDVRRFDTRFFVTRVPSDQAPAHDDRETIESAWMTAADALARCRRDEIALPPPTWTTLRELEPFSSVDEAIAWARKRRIERREPKFLERGGIKMLLLPGDPLNGERSLEAPPRETRFILSTGRWRAEAAPT